MIDTIRGTISRNTLSSPNFMHNLEKLFTRAWLFVGDFFVSRMGEEATVILCRDTGGAVHVFLNSRRHRGMNICRNESGDTSRVCRYRSSTCTTDEATRRPPLPRAPTRPRRVVTDRNAKT
jgi:phenylpropionate dioxygenase-like ring-hydroxylating dioxygenase large terminal subunit